MPPEEYYGDSYYLKWEPKWEYVSPDNQIESNHRETAQPKPREADEPKVTRDVADYLQRWFERGSERTE